MRKILSKYGLIAVGIIIVIIGLVLTISEANKLTFGVVPAITLITIGFAIIVRGLPDK